MGIKVLDNETVNQIAAGEVVERPASVVKELVENAIDAQATSITVEIRNGGVSYIRVSDNGQGIPRNSVQTAFLPHATSKISSIADLETIFSLGFRGEALASIAAVSKIELSTKTKEESEGTCIFVSGDQIGDPKPIGCPEGTTVEVYDLFWSVPARKKFLKKPAAEGGYISDLMNKFALGNPSISFRYIHNDNLLLQTTGSGGLKTAVYYVYGKDAASKSMALDIDRDGIKFSGLIGTPEIARANRTYQNYFVNGRYIKSEIIEKALMDAYKTRLPIGRFPLAVIFMEISPKEIDVNVHPQKLEIKFHKEDFVYNLLYEAVLETLQSRHLIPDAGQSVFKMQSINPDHESMETEEQKTLRFSSPAIEEGYQTAPEEALFKSETDLITTNDEYTARETVASYTVMNPYSTGPTDRSTDDVFPPLGPSGIKEIETKNLFDHYRIVGQVFGTYWVIEQDDTFYLIDQHAAHERILYEEISSRVNQKEELSQILLQPMVVGLSRQEKQVLLDHMDLFEQFGFEIEEFGDTSFTIRAVPYIFQNPANSQFFLDLLDAVNMNNRAELYDSMFEKLTVMACRTAVKANDHMAEKEVKELIAKLLSLQNPYTCPHGRPTIISFHKDDIEKMFKRK